MYWITTTFKPFCQRNGISLLKDDIDFVADILGQIPKDRHKSILRGYAEEWRKGMGSSENALQKQNLGRLKANSWLRENAND